MWHGAVMVDNPIELLNKSQRVALGLAGQAWNALYSATVSGLTHPDEALRQVGALVTAVGQLASATAQPLQDFITSQRELADTLARLAAAQADLADVVASLAQRHADVVQSLEKLSAPVLGLMIQAQPEKAPEDAEKKTRRR